MASYFAIVLFLCFAHGTLLAQSTSPNGAQLFASNCGACHGSDGRSGERAPNIATRREIVALSDDDLIRIVKNGVAGTGMPSFGYMGDDKVIAIVHHLRTLQGIGTVVHLPGDPQQGEVLFFGKAECAHCHMMNGRGGFQADDLTGYETGHSAEDLRAAIVHPDSSASRSTLPVTVLMKDRQQWAGLIRNQDNFSIVLQTGDGLFHLLKREDILHMQENAQWMMPVDYETRLSSKDLDDLVSFLLKADSSAKPSPTKAKP